MIASFGDQATADLFEGNATARVRGIPPDVRARALETLTQLDAAAAVEFMRIPPSNRLEKLKGDRAGQWSVRVNRQWRICFRWEGGHAHDVELVDYHG